VVKYVAMQDDRQEVDDRAPALLEPDALMPSQYFDRLRGHGERSGEWLLVVAILEDAVNVYRRYAGETKGQGRRLFEEAEEWIESRDRDWIFSFESVCDILGLEACYLRRGLRAWKERVRQASRPNEGGVTIALEDRGLRKASGE
jgi:hypothetical protein